MIGYLPLKTSIGQNFGNKKGICYDYANLFAAFCRTQNITCYVIDGYKRTDPNAKHTWNRLYFNESWWNVDLT